MTDVTDGDDKPGPVAGGDAGSAPRRLLTRSPRQKVIGGVCGGLGRYFGIDPVIFRLVLVVLALTGGVGLISYGIGWLLIPMDGDDETELRRLLSGRIEGTSMTAVFCALVGSGLFLSTMDNGDTQAFSLSLIAAIVAAVHWSQRRRAVQAAFSTSAAPAAAEGMAGPGPSGGPADAPPAAQPPPTDSPSWWRTPAGRVSFEKTAAAAGAGRSGYMWGPDLGDAGDGRESSEGRPRVPLAPFEARRRDGEGGLFGAVTFLLAVAVGTVVASAGWHRRPLGSALETGLTAALGVLGLGLVAGSFVGRRGRGIVGWAVVASVLLAVSATMPKSVGTDWHLATWRPTAVARVQPLYTIGGGQGILDLTGVPLHDGTVSTRVDMGAGQIQVRVPRDATVRVEAKVGLGDVRFPDSRHHDVNISPGKVRSGTFPPAKGTKSAGTIRLTLDLGVGQVVVLRGPAS